jgi:hypothetical protein
MTRTPRPKPGLPLTARPKPGIFGKFFWSEDDHQNEALHALQGHAEHLHKQAELEKKDLVERVHRLENEVGRLLLVNHALVEELTRRGMLDGPSLEAAMKAIDLADGVEDGRVTPAATKRAPSTRKRPTS